MFEFPAIFSTEQSIMTEYNNRNNGENSHCYKGEENSFKV